jgi:chromosome segregation ATPase
LKTLYVSLFHVVVDTDDTATKVLDVLNREQNGRVTFMPLNRLRTKTIEYPESNDRMIPMIEVIKYDKAYTKAVEQVNYSALIQICRNYTMINFLRVGIWPISNLC